MVHIMKELMIIVVTVAGFLAGMKYHDQLYPNAVNSNKAAVPGSVETHAAE